jgi:hypothetical protein
MSKNGFTYEKTVLEAIKIAGISGLIENTAGANSNAPDADFCIDDQIYNLEIKLDDLAQMGGSSIMFDKQSDEFRLVSSVPDEINGALLEAISSKKNELCNLLEYIRYEERNLTIAQKFPFSCSKETWEMAQQKNLLVNVKVPTTIDFLRHHLLKKNIHYIQIGGMGLYHVESNPANLPTEQLQGNFTVEIRTGRSGSKMHPRGFKTVTGAIRAQGRLNILNPKARYSMDDSLSIQQMLVEMNCRKMEYGLYYLDGIFSKTID